MKKGRLWVLDTETKGTGAQMVPLDSVENRPEPAHERMWVPPERRPREPEAPQPRAPRRFRVVDVLTRQVLADDADVSTTLAVLGGVERMLDVSLFIWEPEKETWRLLSMTEQQAVWQRRSGR